MNKINLTKKKLTRCKCIKITGGVIIIIAVLMVGVGVLKVMFPSLQGNVVVDCVSTLVTAVSTGGFSALIVQS